MIYFVTENYIKTKTRVQANVDATDLIDCIETSADMQIQPILGTFFYELLLEKYNDQTLSPDETKLVEYIQKVIAWAACAEANFSLSRQLKNKGLQKQFGEFSSEVDFREVAFFADDANQKSAFHKRRLSTYLKKNKDLFPEYNSDENDDSNLKPKLPDSDFNNSIISV